MDLPEGTYTVLVQGERAPPQEIGAQHGGVPVGDRALAFRSATQAVECAVAIEEAAAAPIGVHVGEIVSADAASARPLVLATRLAALARDGQALASALVRELAAGEPGLHFGEAREVSLPGLAG